MNNEFDLDYELQIPKVEITEKEFADLKERLVSIEVRLNSLSNIVDKLRPLYEIKELQINQLKTELKDIKKVDKIVAKNEASKEMKIFYGGRGTHIIKCDETKEVNGVLTHIPAKIVKFLDGICATNDDEIISYLRKLPDVKER